MEKNDSGLRSDRAGLEVKSSSSSSVAIVLAAGASTRMKSPLSKLLHPILGRPMIHWSLELVSHVAEKIVVVVGHQRAEVEASVKEFLSKSSNKKLKLEFALQEKPLGTADAVRAGLKILKKENADSNIFIVGGDCVLLQAAHLKAFTELHLEAKALVSLMTAIVPPPSPYGRICRNAQGVAEKIVEVKEATPAQLEIAEVNPGFYWVKKSALEEALASIGNKANKTREFYLTDIVEMARMRGWLVQTYEIPRDDALGVNNQLELAEAASILRNRINSHWMNDGVTMLDPMTTWIEPGVQLSAGVTLEPGVSLRGNSKLEKLVRVGAHSIIDNTWIGEGSIIEAYCHLKDSKIGAGGTIGPYARTRPGTVLDEDVHLGNFVEVKKSHLQKGVKAGHLSYLGDADIGQSANVGAGTITCNYDGYGKHKTVIGKEVFVGSNSSLVAPVKIGDRAIIGAGSVISENVSADAIALERAKQNNIEKGAKRFREKRKRKG